MRRRLPLGEVAVAGRQRSIYHGTRLPRNGNREGVDVYLSVDLGFGLRMRSAMCLLLLGMGGWMLVHCSSAAAATFNPVADSYVQADTPATNYGSKVRLKTDADPQTSSYLRFDVQGYGTSNSAKLRIYAESNNNRGFQVRPVSSNSWGESSINFGNAPAVGAVIATSGATTAGTWYTLDVSSLVTGDGLVSFALTSTSSTSSSLTSREGNRPPELVVTTEQPPATTFVVSRSDTTSTYSAIPLGRGSTYTGELKSVVQSAVHDLNAAAGGTISFTAGFFDLGSSYFELADIRNITFEGAGIDATVIQNFSSAAADTEPFNTSTSHGMVIRDMTVNAGGPARSTSDAIDMDGGNGALIERVKIAQSRARGIVFDGKDVTGSTPRTADGNLIRDCVISDVPTIGIQFLASRQNRVENCTITNVGGYGIQATKSSSVADQPNKQSTDNVLTGNTIDQAGKDGINITSGDRNQILNNTILNSADDQAGNDGIRITSAESVSCDDNVVSGNTSGDDQLTHTQRYGLNIASSLCNRTVVSGNVFFGNLNGPIKNSGSGTIFS